MRNTDDAFVIAMQSFRREGTRHDEVLGFI